MTARELLRRPRWLLTIAAGVLASLWIAHGSSARWDYHYDAGPPIDALIHGRIHAFLAARPAMGPLSLLYRAPFAALGQALGTGGPRHLYLDDYRFGVFACLMAGLAFGLALGLTLERRGRSRLVCAAATLLCVVNPVSLRSIHFGHPEEILGSALLAGAMLAAVLRRPWVASVLLAAAVLNKQWAIIGAPAVIAALVMGVGWRRLRGPAIAFLAAAVAVTVPLLAAGAHTFVDMTKQMADLRKTFTFPASIWYGFMPDLPPAKAAVSKVGLHDIPDWLGLVARPLILLMGVTVPLAFARRLRQDVLLRAFPLLALVMLLRCMLDPEDNSWYHVPFLFALVAADGLSGRFYATALAFVLLAAPTVLNPRPETLGFWYALCAPAFAIYLGGRAAGVDWVELIRTRAARGPAVGRAPRSSSSGARS